MTTPDEKSSEIISYNSGIMITCNEKKDLIDTQIQIDKINNLTNYTSNIKLCDEEVWGSKVYDTSDLIKLKYGSRPLKSYKIGKITKKDFLDFSTLKKYLSNNEIKEVFLMIKDQFIQFEYSDEWENYFVTNKLDTLVQGNSKIKIEFNLKTEEELAIENKIKNSNIELEFIDFIRNVKEKFKSEIDDFLTKNNISLLNPLLNSIEKKIRFYKKTIKDIEAEEIINSRSSDDLKNSFPSFQNFLLNIELDKIHKSEIIVKNATDLSIIDFNNLNKSTVITKNKKETTMKYYQIDDKAKEKNISEDSKSVYDAINRNVNLPSTGFTLLDM